MFYTDDNLTKKLQIIAKMILQKYKEAKGSKTINEIFIENIIGRDKKDFPRQYEKWNVPIK